MNFEIQLVGNLEEFNPVDLLNQYGIVFGNYRDYIDETNDKDFINFLNNHIEKRVISDFLEESKFELSNFLGFFAKDMKYNAILKDKENEYKLWGSFVLNHTYMIHLVSSYIFIEHIKSKKKWFYYAD